jgi:hypothetical protein
MTDSAWRESNGRTPSAERREHRWKEREEERRMNPLDWLASLLREFVIEDPSMHVYRELQIWDGEKWVSQLALPAGTRHRILHYAGSRRPDDALLPPHQDEERRAA